MPPGAGRLLLRPAGSIRVWKEGCCSSAPRIRQTQIRIAELIRRNVRKRRSQARRNIEFASHAAISFLTMVRASPTLLPDRQGHSRWDRVGLETEGAESRGQSGSISAFLRVP